MVDAAAHREANRRHYQSSVKTNIELMNTRRITALRYYHEKVAPLKGPKKVKIKKEKQKVRILSIENKTVFLFF